MNKPGLFLLALLTVGANANQNVLVNLWHTFVKQDGVTLFWDSKVAPILPEGPEFLHTREKSPSGVGYEIDVTEDTMTIRVNDPSEAMASSMPEGQYDRYYLFVDQTEKIESVELIDGAVDGVRIELIPRGTMLSFQDRTYPVDLEVELKQDTILIELGPNVPLTDADFQVSLAYTRVEEVVAPLEPFPFQKGETVDVDSGASIPSLLTASLLATLTATVVLCL